MGRSLRFVAVVLLSISLGLHWAALQSVAWTSMLVARVQQGTFVEAVRTTFDGKHPCPLCLVVRDGRAAEQQAPATPASSGNPVPKLDLTLASPPFRLVSTPAASPTPDLASHRFRSRSEPPPLPPPRVA